MACFVYDECVGICDGWSEFSAFQHSETIANCNETILNNNDNCLTKNVSEVCSLEYLVNAFDQKVIKCFCICEEDIAMLAPVKVRSQEELMNDCEMWWKLTENFGDVLPIEWSKSYAQQLQLSCLNLNESVHTESGNEFELSDDELAKDLDLHSLIISSLHQEPMFTAEQVLEEIDKIMLQDDSPLETPISDNSSNKAPFRNAQIGNPLSNLLYEEKLKTLRPFHLNEIYLEVERMIKENSEILIQELALRDELEFEKELKNTFISVLLNIQNKKRQHVMERKKGLPTFPSSNQEAKFLTTVIPYSIEDGSPNIENLQVLIKILKAINDDNPVVPGLLTDYILKVLCPT